MDEQEARVRIAAIRMLGAVLAVSIVGVTVVAVFSDRHLDNITRFGIIGLVLLAIIGGAVLVYPQWRRVGKRESEED
jgi:hypothetical protein